jgi:replicative DNA helicase
LGNLEGGTLGHIFARPETGKTSFLASEITNLVSQLEQDETILWCNNEQEESKVLTRFYTTLLNAPEEKIINNIEAAKLAYIQRMGDKIKLYDNAYISTDGIRHLIKTINPRVVVIDQGDKVSFSGSNKLEGHSRLKELYRMFRELAKEFNTHIITVGQASSEAAGKKWLEMHHMDNSRTAKPGEMDYIIGIGMQLSTSDVGEEDELRYLHLCKNKCTGVHSKHIVRFDRTIGRYLNI